MLSSYVPNKLASSSIMVVLSNTDVFVLPGIGRRFINTNLNGPPVTISLKMETIKTFRI